MGLFVVIRRSEGVSSNSSTEKLSMSHSTLARDPAIDQYISTTIRSVLVCTFWSYPRHRKKICVYSMGHFFLQLSHLRLVMFEDDD